MNKDVRASMVIGALYENDKEGKLEWTPAPGSWGTEMGNYKFTVFASGQLSVSVRHATGSYSTSFPGDATLNLLIKRLSRGPSIKAFTSDDALRQSLDCLEGKDGH